MEGLLPLVFKSIKKKSFRRQYNHLSTEKLGGSSPAQSYNISDFYADGYNYSYPVNNQTLPHHLEKSNTFNGSSGGGGGGRQHRRHNSHIGEYYYYNDNNSAAAAAGRNGLPPTTEEEEEEVGAVRIGRPKQQQQQQLVRFRSHRFLPSCVTGAA